MRVGGHTMGVEGTRVWSVHPQDRYIDALGGGFKYCLFSPLLGEMIQFDSYFSNGLEPPPSTYVYISTIIWLYIYLSIYLPNMLKFIKSRIRKGAIFALFAFFSGGVLALSFSPRGLPLHWRCLVAQVVVPYDGEKPPMYPWISHEWQRFNMSSTKSHLGSWILFINRSASIHHAVEDGWRSICFWNANIFWGNPLFSSSCMFFFFRKSSWLLCSLHWKKKINVSKQNMPHSLWCLCKFTR